MSLIGLPIDGKQPRHMFDLSYNELREYIRVRKAGQGDLPHPRGVINHLKDVLENRAFIFFIDCSPSMGEHREKVREAFITYTYLVKQISKNGFEVGFSSQPERLWKFSKTTKAVDTFDRQDWEVPSFEKSFYEFVDTCIINRLSSKTKYLGRKPAPLSILVLTDGNWGIYGDSGVDRPIRTTIHKLEDLSLASSHLVFQFMRFGDNENGMRHLANLDNAGSTGTRNIVDTSSYDADVRRIIPVRLNLQTRMAVNKRDALDGGTETVALPARHSISQPAAFRLAPELDTRSGLDRAYISEWLKNHGESARLASEDKDVSTEGSSELDAPAAADEEETTTLSRPRTHLRHPTYTLPLFVKGLLAVWGLEPSSTPLSTHLFRTTWSCECGVQLSEEVSQSWSNGAENLDQSQPESHDSEPQSVGQTLGAILAKSQRVISATIDITCEALKGLGPPTNGIGSSLPLHNTNANTGGHSAQQNAQPETWLLLCIDKGPRRTSFQQELFLDITNDQALFEFLRDRYFAHRKFRSWFTLRQMQSLALAQFRIDANGYPDIMDHHRYCLQKEGCDCIPPVDRVGESREYRCSPAPAEPPRLVPVLTPERLTHYFLRPHEFADPQTYILEQLPKRSGPQLKAHPGKLAEGWGLHFQEGWHWASVAFICALFAFIGIIFGVVWSAVTADIQSGFAVTAVFVAFPLLPLAFMFNRDSL